MIFVKMHLIHLSVVYDYTRVCVYVCKRAFNIEASFDLSWEHTQTYKLRIRARFFSHLVFLFRVRCSRLRSPVMFARLQCRPQPIGLWLTERKRYEFDRLRKKRFFGCWCSVDRQGCKMSWATEIKIRFFPLHGGRAKLDFLCHQASAKILVGRH